MTKCDCPHAMFVVVRLAKWLENMTTDQEVGGSYPPKVLLDESFQLNIELMSLSGIHKDIITFRGKFSKVPVA